MRIEVDEAMFNDEETKAQSIVLFVGNHKIKSRKLLLVQEYLYVMSVLNYAKKSLMKNSMKQV